MFQSWFQGVNVRIHAVGWCNLRYWSVDGRHVTVRDKNLVWLKILLDCRPAELSTRERQLDAIGSGSCWPSVVHFRCVILGPVIYQDPVSMWRFQLVHLLT